MTRPRAMVAIVLWAAMTAWAGAPPAAEAPTTSAPAAPDPDLLKRFLADCGAKAAAARDTETIAVRGSDGWLFLANELRHLSVGPFWGDAAPAVSRAGKPEYADPMPAIVNFHEQLKKAGIELMLVPVPPKAVIYPEKISDLVKAGSAPPPRLDVHHQAFYRLLRAKGVPVIDLHPLLSAHRFDKEGTAYCRTDTHWSGRACVLAARHMAKAIKTRDWYAAVPKAKIEQETREVEITGDLLRVLKDDAGDKPPPERLPLRFVGTKGEAGLDPLARDLNSPVLVLGDSHGLVFHAGGDMHASGAGLADQLSYELGFAVDVLAVRGSGATPARISLYRRSLTDENYLDGKKLIIWCFAAREFTESTGWRPLPIGPRFK